MESFGEVGVVEFVDGGIHTAVEGEEIQYISFWGFVEMTGAERIDINIIGEAGF